MNSLYKGYEPETLAVELNLKEIEDRKKRRERQNNYLDRVYFSIPDAIPEYQIPDISSSIRFNVADTRSAIYLKSKDSLYLTASRCGCNTCLTDSFISCKVTKHQIHVLSMIDVTSNRTYPQPSSANFAPLSSNLEPPAAEISQPKMTRPMTRSARSKLISSNTKSAKHESSKVGPTNIGTSQTDDEAGPSGIIFIDSPNHEQQIFGSSPVQQKSKNHQKMAELDRIFPYSKSLKDRIPLSTSARLRKINCNLSSEEIACAKSEMEKIEKASRFENRRSGHIDAIIECAFRPSQEYVLGDCDILCNRLRGSGRIAYIPPMKRNSSMEKIEVMNPSTLNSLIRLLINGSYNSPDDFILQAMDELAGGMPASGFESLIIVAYSSVGMKRKLKKGIFQYDNTAGHYVTLHLKMDTSTVEVYDHLNEDFTRSSYFDFKLVSKILQSLHDYHRRQSDEQEKMLEFIQHNVKNQRDSNCGPHAIVNCELLLHKLDPSIQSFDKKLMANIRLYHFLLKHCFIDNFRLSLQCQ